MFYKSLIPLIDEKLDQFPAIEIAGERNRLLMSIIDFCLMSKKVQQKQVSGLDNIIIDCNKTIKKILSDKELWATEDYKSTSVNSTDILNDITKSMNLWKDACLERNWLVANLLFQKLSSQTKYFTYD